MGRNPPAVEAFDDWERFYRWGIFQFTFLWELFATESIGIPERIVD